MYEDIDFVVVPITTSGDRQKDAPLLSLERGMFVKEIELALLGGEVDFAVHSAKDLPAKLPDGLTLAAIGRRQDARDVQVNRWGLSLLELPQRARLGTGSPRRAAQIKAVRADLRILPIRGNVGTRLDKVRGNDYDGVVLAAAGLVRLRREAEISEYLSPYVCTPDVGQGTLAVEAREDDSSTAEMLAGIDHGPTRVTLEAERSFLGVIGGGCKVPVAAYAQLEGNQLHVSAMAAVPDGSRIVRVQVSAPADNADRAGTKAAEALLEAGAREILDAG
jgi:hydroxymethylbilane synthase